MELQPILDPDIAEDMGYIQEGQRIGEIALWRAVLLRGIKDACGADSATPYQIRKAQRWIGTRPCQDFKQVCLWAALDPDEVHAVVLNFVTTPGKAWGNFGRTGRPVGTVGGQYKRNDKPGKRGRPKGSVKRERVRDDEQLAA